MKRVLIATPVKAGLPEHYVHTLIQTILRAPPDLAFDYAFWGQSGVYRARNLLARVVRFDRPADELLFLDTDLHATPEQLWRLAAHNEPVVCALYSRRELSTFWHAAIAPGETPRPDGLVRVIQSAIGCAKISVAVLEQLAAATPERAGKNRFHEFFPTGLVDGEPMGEDYYFCRLCRAANIPVFLDTTLIIPHDTAVSLPIPTANLKAMLAEDWRQDRPDCFGECAP